ncbi:MAG: hypothetical protein JXR05_15220 [Flavobacteriaceae bacterium]
MLEFFREIRKKLLGENKLTKYAIYVFGETILVVIGIMIALQVDDWREQQQLRANEIEILTDFKLELEKDMINFNRAINRGSQAKASMVLLLKHLESNLPYADSLSYHFGSITDTWTAEVNKSVYESLKSDGLSLISNKQLRQDLVRLYDVLSIGQKERNDRYRDFIEHASLNLLNTRFDAFWNGMNSEDLNEKNSFADVDFKVGKINGKMVPLNFEKLKTDQEFLYFLRSIKNRHFWFFEQEFNGIKIAAERLIKNIESELDVLNR